MSVSKNGHHSPPLSEKEKAAQLYDARLLPSFLHVSEGALTCWDN